MQTGSVVRGAWAAPVPASSSMRVAPLPSSGAGLHGRNTSHYVTDTCQVSGSPRQLSARDQAEEDWEPNCSGAP